MTIKEKFIKFTKKFSPNLGWRDDVEDATECEKIADDYAIDFADWCLSFVEYCETAKSIRYYNYLHGTELYTNLQLLEIFKKEKGL